MSHLRILRVLCLPSILLLAACAGEGSDDDSASSEDDLSLPSYVVTKSTELGCGDVVRDAFEGSDSAHGYKLDAKKGKQYHFEFRSELEGNQNATLAIFDAATKRRIAFERGGEKLALDFDATSDKSYVVAAYTSKRTANGKYAMKQLCEIQGQNDLASGQTAFEAEEMQRRFFRGPMLEATRADASGAKAAPNGRTGPVEEADVYKIDGTRLFYLNTYRGFLVYDVANPKAPAALSRLPIHGYPVEMFVQNGVVYALLRDVLELKDTDGQLRFEKKRTSQLVAIDVSNPAQPKLLEAIDIKGDLREGLSRKVGNSIYVVSEEQSWMTSSASDSNKTRVFVHSFDVSNPKDVKKVQSLKIFEGSNQSVNDDGHSQSSWFEGVTISATSNALMVAENWQTYSSVWGSGYTCGSSTSLQEARVSIIDISNPSGAIRVHTKFKTYGNLGDQFKQSYTVDPVTKKARYFGVFARQEWSSANCTGSSHIENAIESWDVTNGAAPVRLQKLAFGKPNETVRGTAFDDARGVLYAITAQRVDPLYAISYTNPSQMKVLSSVDGLSGDMSLFRFIGPSRNFLLAIGTDNSNECEGFDSPATGFTSKVQASIIDVQDASKIRLAQRKCITVNDAQWMGSEVNWNLDQAHKMIGLSEEGAVNLVTVPVYYTKKIAGTGGAWDTYKSETAVGILSWDLTKYDATKPPEQQNVLENASTVVHPGGQVKRSAIYTHPGVQQRRKMLNLSDTHMAIVDIQDPKTPTQDSMVEVAPYKDRVIAFGNHVVEQIQPYTDYGWMENGLTEFRVKVKGPNVDGAPAVATFSAPSVERAVKFGDDALVLFQRHSFQSGTNWVTELTAQVYDMSNPAAPKKAGSVKLPVDYLNYPRFYAGVSSYFFPYWGDATDMVESDHGLVFLTSSWSGTATQRKLVGLNLDSLSSPKVTQVNLSNDQDTTMLGLTKDEAGSPLPGPLSGGSIWLSFSKKNGTKDRDGTKFDLVKYSAQRFAWTGNDLVAQATVNVPGKLAKSFLQGGKRQLLTHDRVFDFQKSGSFGESPRLVLLTLVGNTAKVEDARPFWGMDMRDLVIDDGRVYANLAERSSFGGWGPMFRGPIRYAPPATELRILSSTGDKLSERFSEELGTEGIDLMGVHDRKLFVSLSGDGVLVVDANDVEKPFAREFVRTLGWGWSVEFAGNDALIPAGNYGTYQLSLAGMKRLGQ